LGVIVAVKEGAVWPLLFIVRQGTGLLFKDEIKNKKYQYQLYVHTNKFFKIIVLKTWHFCFS